MYNVHRPDLNGASGLRADIDRQPGCMIPPMKTTLSYEHIGLRDYLQEYLHRPTARAAWWASPNSHVLGPRDLLRPEQGTWLGITAQGRVAVLTNFREEGYIVQEARSRGSMVNAFLTQPAHSTKTIDNFVVDLVSGAGLKRVGGFSLVCGNVGSRLAVVSNRTPDVDGVKWIAESRGETIGLSNAAFGDGTWGKVLNGKKLMNAAIAESMARYDSAAKLVEEMMGVLSVETLPKRETGAGWESYVKELRHSIFIPMIGGEGMDGMSADEVAAASSENLVIGVDTDSERKLNDSLSGLYGTQTQTVILVDHEGQVTFTERSLYDSNARPIPTGERDRTFTFQIDGWRQ